MSSVSATTSRPTPRPAAGGLVARLNGEWHKPAIHPYRGEITIETIARELAQHDLEHLWQVRRLKVEMLEAPRAPEDEA